MYLLYLTFIRVDAFLLFMGIGMFRSLCSEIIAKRKLISLCLRRLQW